ncbi:MAG: TerB family tellurite resistance protein [Myxococcales bacterium]|jgi:uncharacterized tellurite resistance protein B-like protein
MGLLDSLWSALRTDAEFRHLTDEQSHAAVEALVGVVFVDKRMAEEEVKEFERQIQKLPWRWANDERERERVLTMARERAKALSDPDEAHAFVVSIAERLSSLTVREKVFDMCCAIIFADKHLDPEEVNLIGGLRQAFGISELRAREMMGKIREAMDARE